MRARIRALREKALCLAVHWTGIGHAYETLKRSNGAIIVMYHSVAPAEHSPFIAPRNRIDPQQFEAQIRFLKQHRHVISMSALVDSIKNGETLPARTVCITLDDGYLDNLTVAAPILKKYGLPATIYLATGYVSRGESQWADVLHWIFQERTSNLLSVESASIKSAQLSSFHQRKVAYNKLHDYLLGATAPERSQLLAELVNQLKPSTPQPRLTLNWDEARHLRSHYPLIEIGGHTRNHIDLRKYGNEIAESEISDCLNDIRREIQFEPEHFSFPYARWSPETRNLVAVSGWKSAVGMGNDIRITANADRYCMPRIEAPYNLTEFKFKTGGAYPGAISLSR